MLIFLVLKVMYIQSCHVRSVQDFRAASDRNTIQSILSKKGIYQFLWLIKIQVKLTKIKGISSAVRTKDLILPHSSLLSLSAYLYFLLNVDLRLSYCTLPSPNGRKQRGGLFSQHLCHSSRKGFWLALLRPVAIASDQAGQERGHGDSFGHTKSIATKSLLW